VHHMADVVVCDAVLGNVTIKFFEGLSGFIFDLLRAELRRPPRGPIAYALLKPGLDRIRAIFDYEKVGGSLLLGVRGSVIITHGRARRRMISYAVDFAATTARAGVPELIAERLAPAQRGAHGTGTSTDSGAGDEEPSAQLDKAGIGAS
jgi:glycerol-3-phosphate acyltransferase PlsX